MAYRSSGVSGGKGRKPGPGGFRNIRKGTKAEGFDKYQMVERNTDFFAWWWETFKGEAITTTRLMAAYKEQGTLREELGATPQEMGKRFRKYISGLPVLEDDGGRVFLIQAHWPTDATEGWRLYEILKDGGAGEADADPVQQETPKAAAPVPPADSPEALAAEMAKLTVAYNDLSDQHVKLIKDYEWQERLMKTHYNLLGRYKQEEGDTVPKQQVMEFWHEAGRMWRIMAERDAEGNNGTAAKNGA